jgi:hypothetical protein
VGVSVDRGHMVRLFQGDMLQEVKGDSSKLFQVNSNYFRNKENLSTAGVTIAKLVGAAFQSQPASLHLWV